MQNFLVPFEYQVFKTTEAVWDFSKKETIKMFRMTRRGIGEFLTPESERPQKIIDKIIERNPHLRTDSVAVTVTATDGKNYQVETYDIWGVYQICVESDLPRAKEFLRRFPIFMEALFTHKIMPPAIGSIRPEILAYNGVPYNEKSSYRAAVCQVLGWPPHKFYKEVNKAGKMLGLCLVQKMKPRCTIGTTRYPELRDAARFIKAQYPTYGPKKIAAIMSHPAAYPGSIKRWLRAA